MYTDTFFSLTIVKGNVISTSITKLFIVIQGLVPVQDPPQSMINQMQVSEVA